MSGHKRGIRASDNRSAASPERTRGRTKRWIPLLLFLWIAALGLSASHSLPDESNGRPERGADPSAAASAQGTAETPDTAESPDTAETPDTAESPDTVRLMFVGDTMMTGNVAKVMKEKGDTCPLSEFLPVLQQADLVVANLETAVGTSGRLADKTYAFQTDPARFALFAPLRGNILFTLANNHGMDAPLEETMRHLERLGHPYVGVGRNREEAYRPYVAEINGITVAFIGASRVIPTVDWVAGETHPGMASAYADEPLLSTVERWSTKVDHVIVYVHWGIEYTDTPDDVQLELEKKLISAGARLIIGSHPHVLQEIKWNDDKQLTAFSLGNFVFTTSTKELANYTVALDIQLTPEGIANVKVWPAKIDFGLIRYLDEGNHERQQVIERLEQLSPTIRIREDGEVMMSSLE